MDYKKFLSKLFKSREEYKFLKRVDRFKKDKEIYENKNIKTLDTSTKLYEFFEKKEFKEKMIRMFISRPELLNQLRG